MTAPGELPASGSEIELDGSGTETRNITLTDGLWTVAYSVTGNSSVYGSGTNFIVKVESVAGGSELIANEIGKDVSGTTTMRVGSGILELSSGKAVVSVDAGTQAQWTVMLTKQ